jgi:hypothetical protein
MRLAGVGSAKPSILENALVMMRVISHPLAKLSQQIVKLALEDPKQALYHPGEVMTLPTE